MECSVNGCDRGVFAGGMCSKHYSRLRSTGTVEDGPRARADLPTRFWKNVEKRDSAECWLWTGKSRTTGYGVIGRGGRAGGKLLSHRAAWELTYGVPPEGMVVRHRCHNRLCCNPAHLELGSQADNVADMWARDDSAPRGNAKLSEADVALIRSDPRSSRALAKVIGVHSAHIRHIRRGRAWAHLLKI